MRARLGGNVCAMWRRGGQLGRVEAARAGSGPDEDETCQTSRTCSQQHHPPGHSCVCHSESWNQEEALLSACIIQPLKCRGRFSRVYLKTRPEQEWRSSLRRFVCTLSLANGRWKWETPRLLSFPHQSLFLFGPVWRLLDSISGPARIVILESVFVGASTGTDIRSSSLHPVFSCYLFIAEYAEAAILFFWRRPRRCPFSASLSHPLPPSPFPMSSSSPLCVISLSGYHSFS